MVGGKLENIVEGITFHIDDGWISIGLINDFYGKYRIKKSMLNYEGKVLKTTYQKFTSKSAEINLSKARSNYFQLKSKLDSQSRRIC